MAVKHEPPTTVQKLMTSLLEDGAIGPEDLARAGEVWRKPGNSHGAVVALCENQIVSSQVLASALARVCRLPLVDLQKEENPDPAALSLLPEVVARRCHALPLRLKDDGVIVAVGDPINVRALDEVRAHLRRRVEFVVAPIPQIQDSLSMYYRAVTAMAREIDRLLPTSEENNGTARVEDVGDTPIVRTVNMIVAQAVKDRASDIHIEPQRDCLQVRFRIDGILTKVLSLPTSAHSGVVSRIKVLAQMKLADPHPQDGQFSMEVEGQLVDVRVASAESVQGEVVSLRILNRRASYLDLKELGFSEAALQVHRRLLKHPFGMILSAGPTGSGKTTTLYASLNQMDRGRQNIMTIEDPVEYRFDGVTQLQVAERYGLTFATGLRSILRLDPDVVLVGEVRDSETARIAIQAALTGHLVLSSIHANDAVSALFRLADLGEDRRAVSACLLAVIAQRMVRRVCPHCAVKKAGSEEEQCAYQEVMGKPCATFKYGAGCSFCGETGHLGRTGIFELLVVDKAIQQLFHDGASAVRIAEEAQSQGMVTMRQDGMRKVGLGMTTPAEILRHVAYR